ncbi:MAG: 50S ribosomal protein L11 methyltransferase [Gammaproteobacteria bacterium]|nr:50S ribosomal protein L11 methyltransferase [Gammaproteobacteria bacterium]
MTWQQLKLQINSAHVDFFEQQLLSHGALSVTYLDAKDQPVFQRELGSTPLWDETYLVCLFDATADLQPLLQWIRLNQAVINADSLLIDHIEDQDWERSWMTDFKAMQFGQRLWICPSWQTPPDPHAINIILDPGLAFGSGSHTTTALCLEWLEGAALQGKTVIDYGCGSGVLAIASALLGAARVIAVDNDPQALVATISNCDNNAIAAAVMTICLPDAVPTITADVLLANILAEPLIELAPLFASLLRGAAPVVLSGLLPEQAEAVLAAYSADFIMDAPRIEQQWVRLTGLRK